ncbi:hypothetical protein M431DRAFT_19399 [Trichoderma harzianum CBS 226.95]|uniref:Uncharacterized protein n=1 Tax=Trichoderma harzianum CBS 226.95 TaxID=983964 RepID=A0A2T4A2V3_TRIHA|nr:hypothetical protein M431DRAFT_19399 [Trichoderma harzianum CBS 226.95]PTB51390.1 hypothetical protein M431DRAFT_19399 [Trichoderma harzianum CBS 226.95]
MAPKFFSGLWKSLTNVASGRRKVLRRLFRAKQKGNIVHPSEADTLSFQHATDWIAEEVAVNPQGYEINEAERESEYSPESSIGREVDDEASDGAMGVVQPSSQEDRNDPNDQSHVNNSLLDSGDQLTKFDRQLVINHLEEIHDKNISEASKKQMACCDENIQRIIGGDRQTQSWNNEKTLSNIQEALEVSEDGVNSVLRIEISGSSESEFSTDNRVEFRLRGGDLLTPRIQQCLETMFTAFALQLSCCNVNHFMRLKLTESLNPVDDEKRTFFDLYLSSGHDCTRSYWVESRCTFTRELTQGKATGCTLIKRSILDKKKMNVLLKETRNQNHDTQNTSAMESTRENLCPIQLNVSEELSSLATPIVSLASLMKQDASSHHIRRVRNAEKFSTGERDRLCLNLALSLWHMSGRNWNRATWYSDDPHTETGIFFLRDPRTQEIVDKTRPYMSWLLQEESEVQKPVKGLVYDTQLLSFAKLLIEVHTWKKLHLKPGSEKELRSQLEEYIENNFRPVHDSNFISALKACLGYAGSIDATAEDNPQRIQMYICENIVRPLHEYIGTPESAKSALTAKSTLTAMPSYYQAVLDGSNQSSQSTHNTPIYDWKIDDYGKHEGNGSYEKTFWNNMKDFTTKYISPLALSDDVKPCPERKVRIAVIDSGVKEEDAEIAAAAVKQRIRGYRNFTSPDLNDCEDQVDHGTMVARLLLTVAPKAELYIAKVTDQKKMPKNQLHRIAEAIKWAVLEWDVDIISISLALSEEHYDINEEITEALSPSSQDANRKLVFAAAGNWGVYKRRAFPARKEGVIAVHASDGSGEGAKFNPNPESKLNLSTLGENIKIRWPDPDNYGDMKDRYISGSSFATPIAVGIAANVLEFARHRLKLNGWKKDVIYSHPVGRQNLATHSQDFLQDINPQSPHVGPNMDPVSKKPSQSISDASQKALHLFQSCALRTQYAVADFEATERLFTAWTNRLRVFSQSASLDAQLRAEKYDIIRQMVMLLLDVLNKNLSLAHRLIYSDKNEHHVKQSLESLLFIIEESLKRLNRVASVIIQASQDSLIKRTIVFAKQHGDFQELAKIFSLVIFWRYPGVLLKDQSGNIHLDIPEDPTLTKEKILKRRPEGLFLALVKTSIVRHFRILYERDRRDREKRVLLAPAMRSSTPQGANPADDDTIAAQYKSPQSNKSAPGEANQMAKRDDEARSENQLTELSIDVDRYNTGIAGIDSTSPTSDEKSAPPFSEAGVASFPRAPKIPNGQSKGTCPICKQEFPAEELQGAKWIAHATKDIKPYVCISEDCMSDIQFFERRKDWIDHMHKFHTPYWAQYMHKPLRWKCSLCCSDSTTEFISEEEVKTSFEKHLEQLHPHTDMKELHRLVNNCAVPQLRSSEYCPICGTLHQPAIPFEPQSETTSDSGARGTEDASQSQHELKVRFDAPETPNGEDEECRAESPSSNSPNWRSTRATDHQGVENCIAEHLRALALNFSARLIDDDDQQDSDASSSRSLDGDWPELESLPQEDYGDDPPKLPSCICDEIDRFPIPDEEKAEMRECIAKNLHDLCEKSDEQVSWNFDWVDGYRVIEPNIPKEERERLFPDDCCLENSSDLRSRVSEVQIFDDHEVEKTDEPPFEAEKTAELPFEVEKTTKLLSKVDKTAQLLFEVEKTAQLPFEVEKTTELPFEVKKAAEFPFDVENEKTTELPFEIAKKVECQRGSPKHKWFLTVLTLLERGANVNIRGDAGRKKAMNHARDNQDGKRIRPKIPFRAGKRAG